MLARHGLIAAALFAAAHYYQFDGFSSIMLALSGSFLSLFATTYSRYQRRVGVGRAGERTVQQMLSELGVETVHDVYLPTPKGSRQLDHIALFPNSLAVIETKTYNGRLHLDGNRYWNRISRWGGRFKINNPLWQLEGAKDALSAAIPGVRVWGLVVLAGQYTAASPHPSNVVSLEGLCNYIAEHRRRHGEWRYSEQIGEAWARLNALKSEHAGLGKTHVMAARKKRGERFYDFEEIWPLWLWGSLAAQSGVLCVLARYNVI